MSRSEIRRTKVFSGKDSRIKRIVTTKYRSWAVSAAVTGGTPRLLSDVPIIYIPRNGTVQIQELELSYGLNQDPIDVSLIIGFALVDADLVNFGGAFPRGFLNQSLFQAEQLWRSLTAVGVVNTMQQADIDIDNPPVAARSNQRGQEDVGYNIIAFTDVTVGAKCTGSAVWIETLHQQILVDDFGEWEGYTFEESAS